MQRRSWLQAVSRTGAAALMLHSFMGHGAQAGRRHALLVGVSALARQPRSLWLRGPANDVTAMRQQLLAHGFAAADIAMAADDGMPDAKPLQGARRPDRAGILAALKDMGHRVGQGDAVVLYWSGHAVRAKGPPKPVAEADGKSTFLLASDAERMPAGSAWPLRGAVADAELGAAIDDWLAAGAHVLVVMDACYAASATRSGSDGVTWRGLRVSDLGQMHSSGARLPGPAADALPPTLPGARPRMQGYVGLYACEDMGRTPEWSLDGLHHGVFTHALVQALQALPAAEPGRRYAELARQVLDTHGQLARTVPVPQSLWPSPVFEGSLQAPLWNRAALPAWERSGELQGPAQLPVGLRIALQWQQPGGSVQRMELENAGGPSAFLGRLPVGTKLELQVGNASLRPVYLRIFHVGDKGRWHAIYPERAGDAAHLPAASPSGPALWHKALTIDSAERQPESLLFVAAPAQARQGLDDALARLPAGAWHAELRWHSVAAQWAADSSTKPLQ